MLKVIKGSTYIIMFNTETGFEILNGINGNPDPFSLDFPSLLDIGIMGHCLNKCPMCYQGDNNQSHMELETFKSIIDQAKFHITQVALGGRGDPNLHPNFAEIISYAKENNVIPNYTTSGNSLTDEQIEISKLCGACAVSDYDQPFTYSAINRFINANIKTNIHFILSTERFERACRLLDGEDIWNGQFDISKLNAVVFLLFKPQGRGKDRQDLIPSDDQISLFIQKLRAGKTQFKLGVDSCLVNRIKRVTDLTSIETVCLDTCEASRASMYITPDGMAVPCSFACHSANGVQITGDNPIQKIWNESESFLNCRDFLRTHNTSCPFQLEDMTSVQNNVEENCG
jgi:MoaA/NifB/PqqE/SkfB family radical SAM enzyme